MEKEGIILLVTHQCYGNSQTKFSSTSSFSRFSLRAERLASGRTFLWFLLAFSDFGGGQGRTAGSGCGFDAEKKAKGDRWNLRSAAGLLQPCCRCCSAQAQTGNRRLECGTHCSHQLPKNNCPLEIFSRLLLHFPEREKKKQTIKVGAGIEASTDEPCSRCVSGVENLQMSSYSHFLSSQSTPAPPQPRCHFWDFSLSLLLSHRPRLCVWIGGIYK